MVKACANRADADHWDHAGAGDGARRRAYGPNTVSGCVSATGPGRPYVALTMGLAEGGTHVTPAVVRSGTPGAPWRRMPIPSLTLTKHCNKLDTQVSPGKHVLHVGGAHSASLVHGWKVVKAQ